MNRIPYNSKVIVWAVAFIGIVFSAFGDQRSGKSDIPISFEIDGGNSNSVALKVFNTSEKKSPAKPISKKFWNQGS